MSESYGDATYEARTHRPDSRLRFQKAPFFILDEIDAALDNDNVGRVANYIRSRTAKDMQCLVISLKEPFFARADALIGVYRDQVRVVVPESVLCVVCMCVKTLTHTLQGTNCSRTLAIDVNALAGDERETPKKTRTE